MLKTEVGRVLETTEETDFALLNDIADLQPIVAKRHYHETGAMRWYDVAIAPLEDALSDPQSYRPKPGGAGTFLLAVPTLNDPVENARLSASQLADQVEQWDLVVGLSQEARGFTSLARELLATERVRDESPELQGDRVARREVEARIASLRGYIESELGRAFDYATWYAGQRPGQRMTQAQLNGLASDLADRRFSAAPRLHNELLNRLKPSSNAVAAQNFLLRRMAQHEGEERLGIQGFPAEGGLFTSLLEKSGLYRDTEQGWRFVAPNPERKRTRATSPRRGRLQRSCWNPIEIGQSPSPKSTKSGVSRPSVSRMACCRSWRQPSSCPCDGTWPSTGKAFSKPG